MQSYGVTIQMKATKQYFPEVLFYVLVFTKKEFGIFCEFFFLAF